MRLPFSRAIVLAVSVFGQPLTSNDVGSEAPKFCSFDTDCFSISPQQDPCTIQCVRLVCRNVTKPPDCSYCRTSADCVNTYGPLGCVSHPHDCVRFRCDCLHPGLFPRPEDDA